MRKVWLVAAREFTATVMTRGFFIGMLITPALLALVVIVFPRMMTRTPPKVEGEIAVVDPTGRVADGLRAYLAPERIAERREAERQRIENATPEVLRRRMGGSPPASAPMRQSLDAALGQVPSLQVTTLTASVDLEQAKAPLRAEDVAAAPGSSRRLALVVVHRDALERAAGRTQFGSYDLFVRSKLDDRLESEIRDGLRDAIIEARMGASGFDRREIEALTRVDRPQSRTVTAKGEQETSEVLNMLFPAAFMILLLMSVMTSGQYLMTSTVEEKSNRIVEVLLSAVSAMELMTGKILGQMAVGLLVLVLYAGLGLAALVSFAMLGLLDPVLIVFLLVFYVLAYFTIGSFMAAVGASVNEMREAQTLMTPVMLVMMVPWILWLPISREPNSALATVLSFIPPVSNFVMLLRMTSSAPPPMWQAGVSILLSAACVVATIWFAAKVFRIGLLMFGKPPTIGTLVRWVRMS